MMNENLWAPWRSNYITSNKSDQPPGCFLCRYRGESNDRSNYVVTRGQHSLVVLNRYPYNNGHLLVAPLAHSAGLGDLSDDELLEMQKFLQSMTRKLKDLMGPEGFNVGLNLGHVAGAGLPGHLHWHIVPRWSGDTNFMPVCANTKVIPQALDELYDLLTQSMS